MQRAAPVRLPRTTQRLAVHRDHLAREGTHRCGPRGKAPLQSLRVEQAKHFAQGLRRRNAVREGQKSAKPVERPGRDLLDAFPVVRAADDADERREQDLVERIGHHPRNAIIRNDPHVIQETLRHGASSPRLSNPSRLTHA